MRWRHGGLDRKEAKGVIQRLASRPNIIVAAFKNSGQQMVWR